MMPRRCMPPRRHLESRLAAASRRPLPTFRFLRQEGLYAESCDTLQRLAGFSPAYCRRRHDTRVLPPAPKSQMSFWRFTLPEIYLFDTSLMMPPPLSESRRFHKSEPRFMSREPCLMRIYAAESADAVASMPIFSSYISSLMI